MAVIRLRCMPVNKWSYCLSSTFFFNTVIVRKKSAWGPIPFGNDRAGPSTSLPAMPYGRQLGHRVLYPYKPQGPPVPVHLLSVGRGPERVER